MTVPDIAIEAVVALEDRAKPWLVVQGRYAALLSDTAINWLIDNAVIESEDRADAGAILRSISECPEQRTLRQRLETRITCYIIKASFRGTSTAAG